MSVDWKAQRAAQTRREMAAGAKVVQMNMANGIIDQMDMELGIKSSLVADGDNPRAWMVRSKLPGLDEPHVESFWDFPSNELKAKVLLLRGKYGNA